MNYHIIHDKRDLSALNKLLSRFPEDWQKDKVSMAIFRNASRPMLSVGRSMISRSIPNLAMDSSIQFSAKPDKTRTMMRVGLENKRYGRLGHLFNFGTAERVNYTSGRRTGKIDVNKWGRGWWDTAVNMAKPMVEAEINKVAPSIISRYLRRYKV